MSVISINRFKELVSKFETLGPVAVIGDIGIDKYTFGEVKRISPEAPVPVLEVTKEWLKLGLAANVSHNLNTLNVKSTLCGAIGNDRNGDLFEALLKNDNLSIDGLERVDGRATTFKERVVTQTQQICRVDYESRTELDKVPETDLLNRVELLKNNHESLIIEDYAKGTLTKNLIVNLIRSYKSDNKLVTVDPSRTTPPLYYKGATLLKPNQLEASLMVESLGYKETDLKSISEILVDKLDLTMLVITLGGDGMALIDTRSAGNMKIIPTVANEVFDVSGAGDTAISLITAGIMAGATLEEAAWLGNCGSGVVVGKNGTATVNLKELTDFHENLYNKINN